MNSQLFLNPDEFFRERTDDPGLTGPLLVVFCTGVLGMASTLLVLQKQASTLASDVRPFAQVGMLVGAAGNLFLTFFFWMLYAAAFYFISRYFGGSGEFRTTVKLVGWGFVPRIFMGLTNLGLTYYVVSGITADSTAEFSRRLANSGALDVSSALVLVFVLWSAFVWTFAVKYARSLTDREAALTVIPPVLVELAFTLRNFL